MAVTTLSAFATSVTEVSRGAGAWSNINNATTQNSVRATASLTSSGSNSLRLSGYSFSAIPSNATLLGIQIEAQFGHNATGLGANYRLTKNGTPVGDTDSTTETGVYFTTFGGMGDLWNSGLTVADFNAGAVGVEIYYSNPQQPGSETGGLDSIALRVLYEVQSPYTGPEFKSIGTAVGSTAAVSPTVPAHSAGQRLWLAIASGNQPVAIPSGWTQAHATQALGSGTTGAAIQLAYRDATNSSTPAPTVPDAGDHVMAVIWVTDACSIHATTGGTLASTASPSFPAPTTTANECLIMTVAANPLDGGGVFNTGPTNSNLENLSQRAAVSTFSGNGSGMALWTGRKVSAGAPGNLTTTHTTTTWAYITVAIEKVAGPPAHTGVGNGTVSAPTGSAAGTSQFKATRSSDATSYAIASNDTTYAVAREGTGTNVYVSTDQNRWIGQYRASASSWDVCQIMLGFDTSSLPAKAITSAKLVLPLAERYGSAVVEARRFDWTAGTSFVAGSALAAQTLLGSATVTGTSVEIPLTGVTRANLFKLVLAAQAQRTNTAPTGDDTFRLNPTGEYLEVTLGDDIVVIAGTASGTAPAPTGAANGRESLTGSGSISVTPAYTVATTIRERLFGSADFTIPAPTGDAIGSSGFVGVGSGATNAPTSAANGTSAIVGQGAGVALAPTGSGQAQIKINATANGIVSGQTGAALGSTAITGSATGQIAAPTGDATGVSAVPGANGVGFGVVDGANGFATGVQSITGFGSGSNVAPTGSAQGRSAIRGTASGTVTGPTGSATGKVGETGSGNGQITGPTGSGSGRIIYLATASGQIVAPTASGSASVGLTGETATVIEGPWGASNGTSAITGEGSATLPAPTGAATGFSYLVGQEGVGQGFVPAPTGAAEGVHSIAGHGSAVIPAPTATVVATMAIRGVVAIQITAMTGAANGASAISGGGSFTIPAPSGEASGTSILEGQEGVGFGFAEGPSGEAVGRSSILGAGVGAAPAPTASVAVSSGIRGQGEGIVAGPYGSGDGAHRIAGEGQGEMVGPSGQATGTSEIIPITGGGSGMIEGPTAEAFAYVTIRGVMAGMIPAPTGSGFGTNRLLEALPGTEIMAEFDDRSLAADNDDRSLEADADLRSAG